MAMPERVSAESPALELRGLRKVYPGGVEAVAGVDLAVPPGSFFTVVGPSGSGKSTLLRLIAGLEEATAGVVQVGGRDVSALPPRQRSVAMVFQNPALYPHLPVFDNLAFGLRARGARRAYVRSRVAEVAAMLGLDTLLARRPATLSGGQKQRVALGRALATRPPVFLLDEPLSSLDGPLRAALRTALRDVHRQTGATFLHVTHDQAEALALGDRIGVMERGRLVQVGTPRAVYEQPASRFVGQFLGSPPMSVVRCVVVDGPALVPSGLTPARALPVPGGDLAAMPGDEIDLGLRPEHVALARDGLAPSFVRLPGEVMVRHVEFLGHESLATVAVGVQDVTLRLAPGAAVRPGDRLAVAFDLARASWFGPGTGTALS
jgi:multiple sugar transport system ATP-binding protein